MACAAASLESRRGRSCRDGLGNGVDSSFDVAKAFSAALESVAGGSRPSGSSPSCSSPSASTRSGSSSSRPSVELETIGTPPDVESDLRAARQRLEEAEESPCKEMREILDGLLDGDLLVRALPQLEALEFEARKDAARVFDGVVRHCLRTGMTSRIVEHLRDRPEVALMLLDGCGRPDIHLQCAYMLRAYSRCEELATLLLEKGAALRLVSLAQHPTFDVAADAFTALRDLLLGQSKVTGAYLQEHFRDFFEALNGLVVDGDYIAQRQGLRLLGDVLLNADFMGVMLKYVSCEQFLKIHMNLLLDKSLPIKVGAFHVFKIFVANPDKPPRIQRILQKNSRGLVKLVRPFSELREDDDDFVADVTSVVGLLASMAPAW